MFRLLNILVTTALLASCASPPPRNSAPPPPPKYWFNLEKIREITSSENLAEYQIILERETAKCEMEKFKIPLPGYDPRITHTNAGRLAFHAYGEALTQRQEFFSSCMKSKGYVHFTNERLLSLYPKEAGKLGITY